MSSPRVTQQPFGQVQGQVVSLYQLTNRTGLVVRLTDYGATLVALLAPDRGGQLADVVLGFETLEDYLAPQPYLGSVIGRVTNRIAHGRFRLHGQEYRLAVNNGPHHLHGGLRGWDKVVWTGEVLSSAPEPAVRFSYLSPDGEEGYPGNCRIAVTYTLTTDDGLRIDYSCITDRDTPVNPTSHGYFNLTGGHPTDILGHVLQLAADHYTPVDATMIPLGKIAPVAGTSLDFRTPRPIGSRLAEVGSNPSGYDHNYVVNGPVGTLRPVARVSEPVSGRVMEVLSTEPGVQLYTSNFLDGTLTGKLGTVYRPYWGLCLETQHFPDTINQPKFPSCVLRAGTTRHSTTVYRFSVE